MAVFKEAETSDNIDKGGILGMNAAQLIGLYVATILTLMIWSYLYKENILFRFAEYTFIGIATGHLFVMTAIRLRDSTIVPLVFRSQYALIIPVALGLLLYARYSKKTEWAARWPLAILVGVGTGLAIRGMIDAQFIAQILATITPRDPINGTIIAVLTACTLAFFFFTREQIGTFGQLTRVGRMTIMVAMGASFGTLATTRLTLCISRIQFLVMVIKTTLGM